MKILRWLTLTIYILGIVILGVSGTEGPVVLTLMNTSFAIGALFGIALVGGDK